MARNIKNNLIDSLCLWHTSVRVFSLSLLKSVERVAQFVVFFNFVVNTLQFLQKANRAFLFTFPYHVTQSVKAFMIGLGVCCKLASQVDQKFLFELPIIEPFLHMVDELLHTFGLELSKLGHLLILSHKIITFFL